MKELEAKNGKRLSQVFSETIEKALIIRDILINIIYYLRIIGKDLPSKDPFLLLI